MFLERLSQRLPQLLILELSYPNIGENIPEQGIESLRVAERQLGHGVESSGLDDELNLLVDIDLNALFLILVKQRAARLENGLERSQTPIVVLLGGEELTTECEERNELSAEIFGVLEAVGVEQHLGYEIVIGRAHCHRSEELFQVVW